MLESLTDVLFCVRCRAHGGYMDARRKVYIFLGPPGCGKDKQLELLVAFLRHGAGVEAITISDLLEEEFLTAPKAYAHLKEQKKQGINLPDVVVNVLIERWWYGEPAIHRGVSGACRSLDQARFLHEFALHSGITPVYFEITLPEEVGLGRVSLRGRDDDKEAVYRGRYQRFLEYFPEVEAFLTSLPGVSYHVVDGNATPEEVFKRIRPFI